MNDFRAKKLSNSHVNIVQPGIESLETKVLKMMGKKLKSIDNIQTLKMAEKYNIILKWNILFGFLNEK